MWKSLLVAVVCMASVAVAGCDMVSDHSVTFDCCVGTPIGDQLGRKLSGEWESAYFDVFGNTTKREIIRITHLPNGHWLLQSEEDRDKQSGASKSDEAIVIPTELDGTVYLNMPFPWDRQPDETTLFYMIARLEFDVEKQTGKISWASAEAFKSAVESGELKGSVGGWSNVHITSSQEELAEFLRKRRPVPLK